MAFDLRKRHVFDSGDLSGTMLRMRIKRETSDKENRLSEAGKDRLTQVFIGVCTLLGPALGVIVQHLLDKLG